MVTTAVRGSSHTQQEFKQRFAIPKIPVLVTAVSVLVGCGRGPSQDPTANADASLHSAARALSSGDYVRARRLADDLPPEPISQWTRGRRIAAEACLKLGDAPAAIEIYQQILDRADSPQIVSEALFYQGEAYRASGRLSRAIATYRQVLVHTPQNAATHERLAFLLSATGQSWEAVPHYLTLVQGGGATTAELVLFADRDRAVEQLPFLQECAKKAPADEAVELGMAAHAFWEGDRNRAEQLLRKCIAKSPNLLSAQAMLGELLVANDASFVRWHQALPDDADGHPDIWFVRGNWARLQDDLPTAASCFKEAIALDSCHRRATYQLGQTLVEMGHPAAAPVTARARELIQLTEVLDDVLEDQRQSAYRAAAETLLKLGRYWEACAWAVEARRLYPRAAWIPVLFDKHAQKLRSGLPLTAKEFNPALRKDLTFPNEFEVLIAKAARRTPETAAAPPETASRIQFQAVPLDPPFRYNAGEDESTPGGRMFEVEGGGVAVLDFDVDGWPDLYFTQGCEWPTGSTVPNCNGTFHDRLYRGSGSRAAHDVTVQALPADAGFGQGCAVGDFDNDGFDDLYVANVGRNCLLRNMGDGTFEDVTQSAGITLEDWTASAAVADLNADGYPDLFDVNYLRGEGVYTAVCNGRSCSPSNFEGTPDRLLIGTGDGSFECLAGATPENDAKGLGVVLVPSDDPQRPSLFIANDQVANFLLRNRAAENPARMLLTDEALAAGVAFNQDGLAMAGMGVAADDFNGDGQVDLFVTNFSNEANTLFLQDSPGLFFDATNQSGLKSASWPYVGWGTQALDADRDGWSDLVLVNGNVDDLRSEGGEYHMRPQFFRNGGQGRFTELYGEQIGDFFRRLWLGRGLARLDWNRDGLMDFVVSNIGQRAQVVLNRTSSPGRFVNVKLHGTKGARDAIGTRVTVRTVENSLQKVLLAGDGYMASNERMLQFGLGRADQLSELRVEWPSGAVTLVRDLPLDVTVELVEEQRIGTLWRGRRPESLLVEP